MPSLTFDKAIEKFKNKELDVADWNFCINHEDGKYAAYIMGEGAEQCLAHQGGFNTEEEVLDLFESLGVRYIIDGVG